MTIDNCSETSGQSDLKSINDDAGTALLSVFHSHIYCIQFLIARFSYILEWVSVRNTSFRLFCVADSTVLLHFS